MVVGESGKGKGQKAKGEARIAFGELSACLDTPLLVGDDGGSR
jgi:hypothetical protein